MNAISRTNIPLSIATIFLIGVIAVPAAAQKHVSITGELQGQEIDTLQGGPPPTSISVNGSVLGQATHIGRFTLAYQVTVNLPAGNSAGKATLTVPNGDTIFTTIVGQGIAVPNTATLNTVMEVNTITGGTGQFEGVSGYLIVYRLIDLATGLSSGSVTGSLALPAK
jgi:hypothetical protein